MKPLKIILRIWIAITSVLAFIGGWALLGHSNKPAPLFSTTTADAASLGTAGVGTSTTSLPPIPSLDSLLNSTGSTTTTNIQPLPSLPSTSSSSFMPRMRTRGS